MAVTTTRGGGGRKTPAASSVKIGHDVLQILAERISSHDAFASFQREVCTISASGMYVVKGRFKGGEFRNMASLAANSSMSTASTQESPISFS